MFRENSGLIRYIHRPPTTFLVGGILCPRGHPEPKGLDTPPAEHPPTPLFYQKTETKNK